MRLIICSLFLLSSTLYAGGESSGGGLAMAIKEDLASSRALKIEKLSLLKDLIKHLEKDNILKAIKR